MDNVNPAFVLRNYLLQDAIVYAEQGDFTEVDRLLERSKTPFEEKEGDEGLTMIPPTK